MELLLDNKTYNLLIAIQNAEIYYCDDHDYDIRYLADYQFAFWGSNNNGPYVTISTKGRVAIRNYRENQNLIFFNKLISVFTLLIALTTLILTMYQFFNPC